VNPLEGDRVRLRELRDGDLDELVAWWQDPSVARLQSTLPVHPRPASAVAEQFRLWSGNQGTDAGLVVEHKQEGTLLGHVALFGADAHNRTATFAIIIGPPHQGLGYGAEAIRLMVGYGFTELGLHRVQLGVVGFNQRAITAYEKAGFVEEGRARESLFREGHWHDQVHMGVLAREWLDREV